jgi:5-methylcytosine-specific restriction endonuclease McrA
MPSKEIEMPRKIRDYQAERRTLLARGEDKDHAARLRLRRAAEKAGMVKKGDGKDLDHARPLSKGGANTLKNARVTTPSKNRSFPRNKDGSMK